MFKKCKFYKYRKIAGSKIYELKYYTEPTNAEMHQRQLDFKGKNLTLQQRIILSSGFKLDLVSPVQLDTIIINYFNGVYDFNDIFLLRDTVVRQIIRKITAISNLKTAKKINQKLQIFFSLSNVIIILLEIIFG
ncbi:hypothetical protein A3Q56_05080 [Intoshia linei]|uniref:Uncharacterized protein n=1 Tax=Intoshia linei TaxID=1819745 RepID=A0A177AYT5_9BILA|nr:hypothetical protein A3Q56_05080 [Intoshia linei]